MAIKMKEIAWKQTIMLKGMGVGCSMPRKESSIRTQMENVTFYR